MSRFPAGHFHSPVPDVDDLARRRQEIWRPDRKSLPGVALRHDQQMALLESVRHFAADFDYPDQPAASGSVHDFFDDNTMFSGLDSRMLFCLLRHFRPARLFEIGSGFSTLLAADVKRRFLAGRLDLRCLDPYPRPFLHSLTGIDVLDPQRLEEAGGQFLGDLTAGDMLFIDSSHVCRTGSDVNQLFLEILPGLPAGVVIHVHDIFFPLEYPEVWVLEEGRFWNEQYLLQALLCHSNAFEVLFGSTCAAHGFSELVQSVFGQLYGGSSLWICKRSP